MYHRAGEGWGGVVLRMSFSSSTKKDGWFLVGGFKLVQLYISPHNGRVFLNVQLYVSLAITMAVFCCGPECHWTQFAAHDDGHAGMLTLESS